MNMYAFTEILLHFEISNSNEMHSLYNPTWSLSI